MKKDTDGKEQVSVIYPKFKNGEATVSSIRVKQNFGKQIRIIVQVIFLYMYHWLDINFL